MERTAEVERLTEHGCAVLCLDCPEGILFGIDYSAWTVGPRFMGVKLIPPGLHYVYSSGSPEDNAVGRTGFFLFMQAREVAVFRWDAGSEELVRLEQSDEEARYVDGVRGFDFDSNLGPYPLGLSAEWSELTRHASARLVSKIEPVGKVVRQKRAEYDAGSQQAGALSAPQQPQEGQDQSMSDNADALEAEQPRAQSQEDGDDPMGGGQGTDVAVPGQGQRQSDDSQGLESNQGAGSLFFSAIPRLRRVKGSTPAETTSSHMDRSAQLEQMVAREYDGNEMSVLGELQLAYIAFILGQNYDGFEQWRALLRLLCSCESGPLKRPELFAELCRAFFAQLSQAPSDLFGDDLTKDNFLGSCALSMLELCDTQGVHPKLRKRCGKLRELVQEKFGISTEDLALIGDDAPQIVDAEGRDLISFGGPSLGDMD